PGDYAPRDACPRSRGSVAALTRHHKYAPPTEPRQDDHTTSVGDDSRLWALWWLLSGVPRGRLTAGPRDAITREDPFPASVRSFRSSTGGLACFFVASTRPLASWLWSPPWPSPPAAAGDRRAHV